MLKFLDDICSSINDGSKCQFIREMLDDTLIKGTISPFAVFPDDKMVNFAEGGSIDIGQTVKDYQSGMIDQNMLDILGIVIEHRFITSRQIWQVFFLKTQKYIVRKKFDHLLDKMVRFNLISSFNFSSAITEKSNYKVFCAAYNGIRLYSAINKQQISYWNKTFSVKQPWDVKRYLANNQLIISFMKRYQIQYFIRPDCLISLRPFAGKKVVPLSQIECTNESNETTNSIIIIVEVVRRYDTWKKDLLDKLSRYATYLDGLKDTQQINQYYLVICMEDLEQYEEVFECYRKIKYDVNFNKKAFNVFFTYDRGVLDGNLKEDDVLSTFVSKEYNGNVWLDKQLSLCLKKISWENSEIVFDEICMQDEIKSPSDISPIGKDYLTWTKEELYRFICNTVNATGLSFPIDITRLNIILRQEGFDYSAKYKKCKDMFLDLQSYFSITYPIPTKMLVNLKEGGDVTTLEESSAYNPAPLRKESTTEFSTEIEEQRTNMPYNHVFMGHCTDGPNHAFRNLLEEYFSTDLEHKKQCIKLLHENIYMKNKEMSATVLSKLTHRDELSVLGWGAIIAFSFDRAMKNRKVFLSPDKQYLCFKLGLKSTYNDEIYLLAIQNNRGIGCPWILMGIGTRTSHSLGQIIHQFFNTI